MLRRTTTAVAMAMLGVAGCTSDTEDGFKDSRPEFMREMKAALAGSNIPFREDAEGSIKYPSKHNTAVSQVRDRLEKELSGGVVWKLEDQEPVDYLKSLLGSMGIKYVVEVRKDGEWIRWYPLNEAQEREVGLKVVQHRVESRAGKPVPGGN